MPRIDLDGAPLVSKPRSGGRSVIGVESGSQCKAPPIVWSSVAAPKILTAGIRVPILGYVIG